MGSEKLLIVIERNGGIENVLSVGGVEIIDGEPTYHVDECALSATEMIMVGIELLRRDRPVGLEWEKIERTLNEINASALPIGFCPSPTGMVN